MKLTIFDKDKNKKGEKNLPSQFSESFRPDLIKRAVNALRSAARQPYGTSPEAGKRHSSKLSKRRRKYRGCYGFGISRVNRKILSRRGTRMYWVGTFSPQTVGGRRAHPPKAGKIFEQKINQKERRKAIRSAMAAAMNKTIVTKRGHKVPEEYPFILDSSIEQLKRTVDVKAALKKLGFESEMERSLIKKIRSGMGKLRGRKYQKKKGLLVLVGDDCPLLKAAQNIPGLNIAKTKELNTEMLAPGSLPGRATLWTEKAVDIIEKEKLFA